jgi:D-galactarolactone cycloisomerase
MKINHFECFTLSHPLDPRTGPSIAYGSSHAYVLVRLTADDGTVGWGETYNVHGMHATVSDLCSGLLAERGSLRTLLRWVRIAGGGLAGGGMACSSVSLALEDVWARQQGLSVAAALGGPVRTDVRAYAASGGYVEGRHPRDTWADELARALDLGFTAIKWRIGRYPIAEEAKLLEKLRSDTPAEVLFMADGNAGYTFKEAVRMGRILTDLGFFWFEEPMEQRGAYVGYDRLAAALDIELAGGEAMVMPSEARNLFERRAVDIVQPDPVIAGGASAVLAIAEMAACYGIRTTPHTSNSGIGISAGLQVLACLPDATRSPASPESLLEFGIDDSPWRRSVLTTPHEVVGGRVAIPSGPGFGVEVDEAHVRAAAIAHTSSSVAP